MGNFTLFFGKNKDKISHFKEKGAKKNPRKTGNFWQKILEKRGIFTFINKLVITWSSHLLKKIV